MISIYFSVPPNPCKGDPGGGARGPRGGFSLTLPKIMYYINSEVFISGNFKNDIYFHLRVV
jgi:hypothetical protein